MMQDMPDDRSTKEQKQGVLDDGDDNDDDDDEKLQKQHHKKNNNRKDEMIAHMLQNISVSDFVFRPTPWVLVENGSFLNAFDFVPERLRTGPWNITGMVYLCAIQYLTVLAGVYSYTNNNHHDDDDNNNNNNNHDWHAEIEALQYPEPYSLKWNYNVLAFLWMCYISYLIAFQSPFGHAAWMTYTVQSWTLLTIRHLLCALAPYSITALYWAEYTRFPAAVSPTITFTIWNFILFPVAYLLLMKSDEQRTNFFKFCTSFRMMNIHFLNIILCILNVKWASPPEERTLQIYPDFYISMVSMVSYMTFYMCVLDRLGIHLYPPFSPRSKSIVIVTLWSFTLFLYGAIFYLWKQWLKDNNDYDDGNHDSDMVNVVPTNTETFGLGVQEIMHEGL